MSDTNETPAPPPTPAPVKFGKQMDFLLASMADEPTADARRDVLMVSEALARTVRTAKDFNPWPEFAARLGAQPERTQRTLVLRAFAGLADSMRETVDNTPSDGPDIPGGRPNHTVTIDGPGGNGLPAGYRAVTGVIGPGGTITVEGVGELPFKAPPTVPVGSRIEVALPAETLAKTAEVREQGGKVPDWLENLGKRVEEIGRDVPPEATTGVPDAIETFAVDPKTGETRFLGGENSQAPEGEYTHCPDCGGYHLAGDDHPPTPGESDEDTDGDGPEKTDPVDVKLALGALFDALQHQLDDTRAGVKYSRADVAEHLRATTELVGRAGLAVAGLPDEAVDDVWAYVTDTADLVIRRSILLGYLGMQRLFLGTLATRFGGV